VLGAEGRQDRAGELERGLRAEEQAHPQLLLGVGPLLAHGGHQLLGVGQKPAGVR
jgi:hypothetical protein